MFELPTKHRILIVDDEPDIHSLTKLSLKKVQYNGKALDIVSAHTGKEAVEVMRTHPDTALILLDVVMESPTAGLDACRAIREELGNKFVRIVLRTGQPGVAPERKVIDEYDIDGYLPKSELTTNRLYTTLRTALKAFEELVALQRYREILTFLHQSVSELQAFRPLEETLQHILQTALAIAPCELGVLNLETFQQTGYPRQFMTHLATGLDPMTVEAMVAGIVTSVTMDPASLVLKQGGPLGEGYLFPLMLHRDLGNGWLYLHRTLEDPLLLQTLPMLASHAANALYASVAQAMLSERDTTTFYQEMAI